MADIQQIRERLARLTPDERMELEGIMSGRQREASGESEETTVMSRTGRPLRPFQGQENTDLGYPDNPLADKVATGMGAGLALTGPAAAVQGAMSGGAALLPALGQTAVRATRWLSGQTRAAHNECSGGRPGTTCAP